MMRFYHDNTGIIHDILEYLTSGCLKMELDSKYMFWVMAKRRNKAYPFLEFKYNNTNYNNNWYMHSDWKGINNYDSVVNIPS